MLPSSPPAAPPAHHAAAQLDGDSVDGAPVTPQHALDAFRRDCHGPYRVGHATILAPPVFRPAAQRPDEPRLRALCQAQGVPDECVEACVLGLPGPTDLVRVTQALIDAGELDRIEMAGSPADRIRALQSRFGLGFDADGYVAQAFVAVHGTRQRRTRAVYEPSAANPGDQIELATPALVYAVHELGADEIRLDNAAARSFAEQAGSVLVFEVDSVRPPFGVSREGWFFDETSRRWGWFDPSAPQGFEVSTRGPHGEVWQGILRASA